MSVEPTPGPKINWRRDLEQVERLRQLAAQGHSTSEIARTMRVTRNAISGACHRLGITVGGVRTTTCKPVALDERQEPKVYDEPSRPRRFSWELEA